MAIKIGSDLKSYIISKGIIEAMSGTCGTGGTASVIIYSGTQPANADAATSGTSGTILCTISSIGWGGTQGATAGTVALSSTGGMSGTAVADGTAGWARLKTVGTGYTGSAATFVIDGNVGTASTCDFVINSVSITSGGAVSLLTAPISIP